jgi:hypothetical protein
LFCFCVKTGHANIKKNAFQAVFTSADIFFVKTCQQKLLTTLTHDRLYLSCLYVLSHVAQGSQGNFPNQFMQGTE